MNWDQFWLTEAQFSKIEPYLPTDTRGKARVDDRRVISGIVHVLKSGGRWVDAPPEYGPKEDALQSLRAMGGKGRLGRSVPRARAGRRPAGAGSDRQLGGQGASLGGGRKRGEKNQAIGRSRGGRTTKIHALTDAQCRPLAFMLTGGQVADCTAGAALLDRLARLRHPACGQGLRRRRHPPSGRGTRRDAQHPAQGQSQMEELLLAVPLPKPQRDRAHVLPLEGLQARRHAIRSKRRPTSSPPSASPQPSATGYESGP